MKKLNSRKENLIFLIFLSAVVFIASLPAFRSGIYNGFDLWFHMGRIESIATELANGQFPVRYETESWYGNGYISTVMYGNIFLYLPAVLHMLGLATYRCYNLYIILVNIAGVAISFYSFTRLFKDKKCGLLATGAYMLAGYYISNMYMRAAVGEYTATIFIPLVVYGIYRILFENLDKNIFIRILPLIIGATGLIQAHVLTTFMVAMMAFVFLIVFIKETWAHIIEFIIALTAILGINAFFLIPFIDSYTSYSFRAGQSTVGVNIQKYGLYLDQILGLFPEGSGGRAEWSSQGEESSRIGIIQVSLFIAMVLFLIFSKKLAKNKDRRQFKMIISVFLIGVLSAWLSSAYFPWWIFSGDNAISNVMRGIQYPSRYMLIQTIAWTICGTFALKTVGESLKEEWHNKFFVGIILLMSVLAVIQNGIFMYTLSCRNLSVQTIEGHESIADDLYLFSDVDMENIESKARLLSGNNCTVEDLGYKGINREISIDNNSDIDATVLVPVFSYKYIEATDSNGQSYELKQTDSRQYQVTVESGFSDTLMIRFRESIMWRMAELVSIISLVIIAIFTIKGTKKYSYER